MKAVIVWISAGISLFTMVPIYANLPINVVSAPSYPISLNLNASTTLTYTIRDNVNNSTIKLYPTLVTSGSEQTTTSSGTIVESGGTCSHGVTYNHTCTIQLTYTAPSSVPSTNPATASIIFGYGGRNNISPQRGTFTISSTYVVTPSAGANGSISPNTPQTVTSGNNIIFTASPNSGYGVSGWTVDGSAYPACSTNTNCELTNVTADHTISVSFLNAYIITPATSGSGSISPNTPQTVLSGDNSPTFTATPTTGYYISSWSLDSSAYLACGTNLTCQLVNVTADHVLQTNFSPILTASPSLVLTTNTPGVSGGAGTGSILVTNTSSGAVTGGLTVDTTGTNLTVSSNGCSATLSAGSSCTISFTSSNVTADASSGNSVTVSNNATNTLVIPIATLNAIVMSPPLSDTSVAMLLVNGCATPEVIEIINNSTIPITGISVSANGAINGKVTITNYCNGITLNQNNICMIWVATNTGATGDTGTITITNSTNSQNIALTTKVEAVHNLSSYIPGSTTVQGDTVFYADPGYSTGTYNVSQPSTSSCNLVKVGAHSDALSATAIQWITGGGGSYQFNVVPYPNNTPVGAQDIYQGQTDTISIVAAGYSSSQALNGYTAGGCVLYTENNGGVYYTNWYEPSICEVQGNYNQGGVANPTCQNSTNNIFSVQGSFSFPVNFYWTSTEGVGNQPNINAWMSYLGGSSPFGPSNKTQAHNVRCVRAFTD